MKKIIAKILDESEAKIKKLEREYQMCPCPDGQEEIELEIELLVAARKGVLAEIEKDPRLKSEYDAYYFSRNSGD